MTALLANNPEGLIATAIVTIVAGLCAPAFFKLGYGYFASGLLGLAVGVLALIAFGIHAAVADWFFDRRLRRSNKVPPPEASKPPDNPTANP